LPGVDAHSELHHKQCKFLEHENSNFTRFIAFIPCLYFEYKVCYQC
jgi:hypothetical protein